MTAAPALDEMSLEQLEAEVHALTRVVDADRYDWARHGRPDQFPPAGAMFWFILAGAGWGKTRTAAETLRLRAQAAPLHIAVVHEGDTDVRDICFEHRKSGLLAVTPPEWIAKYKASKGDTSLTLVNGSVFRAFTSNDPEALKGYDFDGFWFEEFAAWGRNSRQAKPLDCWDIIQFRLREAKDPFGIITTTPKNVRHMRALVEEAKDPASGLVITHGRTLDNAANLSPLVLARLKRKYQGTRLGRQELEGEMLEDVDGALWTTDMIENALWRGRVDDLPERLETVTVVDPSGSSEGDATGIVTLARGRPEPGTPLDEAPVLVLADDTTQGPPEHRYETAILAAHRWGSGTIAYESLYGGDNVAMGLRAAHKHLRRTGRVDASWMLPRLVPLPAKGSKADRAQPVAQLYGQQMPRDGVEQPRLVIHTAAFPELHDEQTQWTPTETWSPNRLDALVHGVRWLTKSAGMEARGGSAVGMSRPSGDVRPGRGLGRRL